MANLFLQENLFFFLQKKKKNLGDNFMGQITLPVLNRKGYSSIWESTWDDKKNFSEIFNEDQFLKQFFNNFFCEYPTKNPNLVKYIDYKTLNEYKKFSNEEIQFLYKNKNRRKILKNFFLKKKTLIKYSSIYILRYNNWLFLYLYSYRPSILYKKTDSNSIKFMKYFIVAGLINNKSNVYSSKI